MYLRLYLLLMIISLAAVISAIEYVQISQLDAFDLQHPPLQPVAIRGFLYRSGDERWILASEPNLKSCCIGSNANCKPYIVVHGDFTEASKTRCITLQGTLRKAGTGERHLDNASLMN